ncbi:MAG: hypothetical protein IJ682_04435 [Lachnospiraceae bacterium]|nr:hypothetical protein [Lachnospiraceae bacterium]
MRKYYKNQCKELIRTLEEAHGEIVKFISKNEIDTASALLEQCQQAAVAIGEIVESAEGENTDAVNRLEAYCELTYNIHQDLMSGAKVNPVQTEKKLKKLIRSAQNNINALPTKYEVVFLPYKASMWDSLESIWMAADEDENCDAYVIPIPYYDRNTDGSFKDIHYEGALYPEEVPITNYAQYDMGKHHPDVIFIHNPYDDWNTVTSVHPDFYSGKLRQYTDCLVYVPYFAAMGLDIGMHAYQPCYQNVDYIIAQSEEQKKTFHESVPQEKILPLGSPKFDRVIRMCQNPPLPPNEWSEKAEGKRVYFYNTSIAGMLEDTERFLKKVKYVFSTFQKSENACIVWRPHPLLESTFKSMRPEYLAEFQRIKEWFIKENIGIFDATPDIEKTISFCDAYIGDIGTSVVSLFEAAGKEIYILDNKITEIPPKDWWKGSFFYCPTGNPALDKYIVMPNNKLFWSPDGDYHYEYFCDLSVNSNRWEYLRAYEYKDKIFVFPFHANDILIISEDKNVYKLPLSPLSYSDTGYQRLWILNNQYAFLIPGEAQKAIRFEFATLKIKYFYLDIAFNVGEDSNGNRKYTAACLIPNRRKLLFSHKSGNQILLVDADTFKAEIIPFDGKALLALAMDENLEGRYIWFLPHEGTDLISWDMDMNKIYHYDLDNNKLQLTEYAQKTGVTKTYFRSCVFWENEVLIGPQFGNQFLYLDKNSGEVKEWNPPFRVILEDTNQYMTYQGGGYFIVGLDRHPTGYFNYPERKAYNIDFEHDTCEEIPVEIDDTEILDSYKKGFYVKYPGVYICEETPVVLLQDFISGDMGGEPYHSIIQKEEFARINASVDGDCGEKVYQFIVNQLL